MLRPLLSLYKSSSKICLVLEKGLTINFSFISFQEDNVIDDITIVIAFLNPKVVLKENPEEE